MIILKNNMTIYSFSNNDFLQFRHQTGGVFVGFCLAHLDNPCLVHSSFHIYRNPQFVSLEGEPTKTKILFGPKYKGSSYDLARDLRQPKVCQSCTPIPKTIRKGVVLSQGGWAFVKSESRLGQEIVDIDRDNNFFYITEKGEDVERVISNSLAYVARAINSRQEFFEELGLVSRASEIRVEGLARVLKFIKKDQPGLM